MTGKPIQRARGGKAPSWRAHPELNTARPPFAAGNVLARRHGVYRETELRAIAEALADDLVAVAPWCAAPPFGAAVARWAWAEAACSLYRLHFAEHGLFDDEGESRPGLERWQRFETTAARAADALGLNPTSMAKLLGSLSQVAVAGGDADALEHLKAEGRKILEARGLAAVPDDPQDAA